MNDFLDYESPNTRRGWRWPADWRRRRLIAAIAASLVFLITFEVARRMQSSAVYYMRGGMTQFYIRDMQKHLDAYVKTQGVPPVNLTDVPEIRKEATLDPGYLLDTWRSPYVLKTVNHRPLVVSYGRDNRPGGSGLDADIDADHPYGSELMPVGQFIQNTHILAVAMICVGNAVLVVILSFSGTLDTREPSGLWLLLIQLVLKAAIAVFVASLIAVVHAPSGH